MYQPPKFFWNKEDIQDFYTVLQPYIQGLNTDLMKNFSDVESAVTWWDNHEDGLIPLGDEVSTLYSHKVQTFNNEKNRFEVNPNGIRFRSLAYTWKDDLHNVRRVPNNTQATGSFNAAQYSTACQLVQDLGDDCVCLHYMALAPRTIKFRTVINEYRFVNDVARIYIPLVAPEAGAAFHIIPGGEIPRVEANRVSEFKDIFVHDVHKFTEIFNDSDSWLVCAVLDVPRSRLGLPDGPIIDRQINSFSQHL